VTEGDEGNEVKEGVERRKEGRKEGRSGRRK
jgi:hypothetical protein